MTESLARLLLRLSEAGEPAILWGRQAKPYLGRDFERLIEAGILVEDAPATEWDVCASCECDLDVRPIQQIDGRCVAACPLDHHRDITLDGEDVRSFRIQIAALVREIVAASGLMHEPTQVVPGVWHLGVAPAKRGLFLSFARDNVLAPGLISSLRTIDAKLPITIVGPVLPVSETLRFVEAQIYYVPIIDAFAAPGTPFALDTTRLMPPSSIAARLTLVRDQSKLILDGRELELPPISFKLMWLLAEQVVRGGGMVSRRQIEQHLWKTVVSKTAAADAIRNLRNALKKIGKKGKTNASLVETLPTQGYILNLAASDIRLVI
jgi:DNA-binding winged helix-turn-helix (wHTH) protein